MFLISIFYYILLLSLDGSNISINEDNIIIKTSWKINEATVDSCLMQRTTFYEDSFIIKKFNYYDCKENIIYYAKYAEGLLKKESFYKIDSSELMSKYFYKHDKNRNLISINTFDYTNNDKYNITIENHYDESKKLINQVYSDSKRNIIRNIEYKRKDEELKIKTDNDLLNNIRIETYFENGFKTKQEKNGNLRIWIYNEKGQLKEFIKNKYEKDIYIYDDRGNLTDVKNLVKRGDGITSYVKEKYQYYPNDSLKVYTINENERWSKTIKYYYSYKKSKSNQ